jgi:hypothetical protein
MDVRSGQFIFSSCKFEDLTGGYLGGIYLENLASGEYATSQYVRFDNCIADGLGVHCFSVLAKFNDCEFRNSFMPFYVGGNGGQNIEVNGLRLVNVFDATNIEGGGFSSLFVASDFEGAASSLRNVEIVVDVNAMPTGFAAALAAQVTKGYGILLSAAATGKMRVSNVNCGGFYRQLPTALGQALNANNFRDWSTPNLPPADTAGQITNASVYFYRGATMYGDAV